MQYSEFKPLSEDIEQFKICSYLLIYQRMNETFSDNKSFIWRLPSPYNNKAFSFEIAPKSFVQPMTALVSLKFKSRNQRNIFTFRSFTHIIVMSVWVRIVSIPFWQKKCISKCKNRAQPKQLLQPRYILSKKNIMS